MQTTSNIWKRLAKIYKGTRRRNRMVVFAPNAWFRSMLSGPAIIAKTLAERGYRVDVISCAAERLTCTIMDGMAPLEKRPARQFCEACTAQARDYLAQYGLNQMLDTDFLNTAARQLLEQLKGEIGSDPRSFVWDNIPIGIFATGNLSAITKRDLFTDINEELSERLRIMVEDGLRWYVIAKNMYQKLRPKHLVYYAEYYPEIIVGLVMQRQGVHVVPVGHSSLNGNDFRKVLIIEQMPQVLEVSRRLPTWPMWRELPLMPTQVREICDDAITRFLGNSPISFSPALNKSDELAQVLDKLRPNLKTIVIFTSSNDELNNTKMQREVFGVPVDTSGEIFPSQIAWLQEVAEFVATSDDHQMIVRLHPRLGSNKRGTAVAEYRDQVEAVSKVNCPRIHVILPENPCSSYDLAQLADLVLTSWSSMGLECVRMGLPVMMAFRGADVFPSDCFLNFCTDRRIYFERLKNGISTNIDNMLKAFRYTNLFFCADAIDLSDIVPHFNDPCLPPFSMPLYADEIEDCTIGMGVVHHKRLAEQRAAQTKHSVAEEQLELAQAIRRIIHTLAFGIDATPAELLIIRDPSSEGKILDDRLEIILALEKISIRYRDNHVSRRSNAIRNLAVFHEAIMSEYGLPVNLPSKFFRKPTVPG